MRKYYFLVLGLLIFSVINAQIVNIPDANFKAKLLEASVSNSIAQDISGNLIKIDANNDGEIQVSEVQSVYNLNISDSNISSLEGISSFSDLFFLRCSNNKLTSLDVTSLVNLFSLDCSENQLTSINLGLQLFAYLNCSANQLTTLDLQGLVNLTELDCSSNQLTLLDFSPSIYLNSLICSKNRLTTLDVDILSNLKFLECSENNLTVLEVTSLLNLTNLNCKFNNLTSLDLSNQTNLEILECSGNQLALLDIGTLSNLKDLSCFSNQLTSLNLSNLTNLEILDCSENQITSLDLSNLANLQTLNCTVNNLSNLFIKNTKVGFNSNGVYGLRFSSDVQYICTNDKQLADVQKYINQSGYTNTHVNTYCSFVPGAESYSIIGNTKLDSNNNGCDVADTSYTNLKFSISNGTVKGNFITNSNGNYSIPVSSGTHTITPVIENPSYFSISPTNGVVNFPVQSSPFSQDFCITTNGVHKDLEVTFLPIDRARPGFDASYKIIYRNKGTNMQSGSLNLTFDDAVLDVVTVNPVITIQSTDNLTWDFIDLKPFETREIEVTLNVNSPMETPAVNNDDRLSFTALINPINGDEQPVDNSFALRQLVVGSYDPNDKTCLEGETIPPSAVGKFVHYMIRFENKGTAEAENVVVKDLIDTSKFDISSLVVTQGSHPFVTKVFDTNKVEFIFENINLPFDDATNDGYVAFKIKTKPSLLVGDSFSNTASIYFDYNFPIITNTATTSVLQNLGTQDFEFSTYFSVYPNPAKAVLNIDVKKQIELTSISVFNTLGQQMLVIPNAQKTKQVDVSSLKTGNYFLKVTSDKGSASGKFLKE